MALPLAAAGGFAIKFASDLEESMNKADVAFGKSAGKVKDFADTALNSFGISEGAALDMMAMFGDMGTSMGLTQKSAADMSISMTGLAGDLSSFKNIPVQQAMTALAGVFTGETESLKRLGIVMTEVNLKAFALEQGIKKQWKEMTQAEKVNLRYQFILKNTKNAQGGFARTSEGAANQMRIFQESLKELGADFGEILLPVFTKAITKVNDLLKKFRELSDETKKLIVSLGAGAGIGSVLIYLTGIVIPPFIKGIKIIKTVFSRMNPIVLAVVTALTAFSIMIDKISNKTNVGWWETLGNVLKNIGGLVTGNVSGLMADQAKSIANTGKPTGEDTETTEDVEDFEDATTKLDNRLKVLSVNAIRASSGIVLIGSEIEATTLKAKDLLKPVTDMNALWAAAGQQLIPTFGQALADSFAAIGEGENPIKRLMTILKALIVRLLAAAAAAFILSSLLPSMFGDDKATKGVRFLTAFGDIMKFNNGGIISGPTVGLMGEYPGARSNPEVVAPLSKLKSLMNNNVSSANGEFILRGQDLVLALQRAERNRTRII